MKKTISTMIAIALTATVAFAQQPAKPAAQPATAPAAQAGDPIVIAAGDLAIRQSEFEGALKTLPAEYQQFAMGAGKRQFAEDFLRMKMLAAQGMKNGLDKDPEVLRQLALMRENLVANAQLAKVEKDIKINDEDLKKAYDAKKNEYEQVNARHILITFKGTPVTPREGQPELTEEQAKAKAEELKKQLVAGASFDELAKKESDDVGSGAEGGSLGDFARGQMVPEFEKAAFEAKPGEITGPVRTPFGFHIIKVEKHDYTPFEQVKAFLERNERQTRLQTAIDAMKNDVQVTYNDAYFGPATPPAPQAPPPAPKQ